MPEQAKTMQEVVFLRPEDPIPAGAVELKPMPPKGARTIEPIYSFGPVSVNGAGSAYGSAYGSALSHQASIKPFSYGASSSYAAQPGLQFHAMIPYMIHRQPHHSLHAAVPTPIKPEISYYFDNSEPVYVESEDHGETHAQQSPSSSPVSLYCQSLKSKDLVKTLTPVEVEPKSNTTEDSFDTSDHIQRVNEIKEEISQLNQAAQRIVDQQEKLAQMQQQHIAMAERSANLEMRNFPMRGPTRIRRPFIRENEDTGMPKEDAKAEHGEMMMRQGYGYPYEGYYGYRSAWPYMPAYETGLPIYKAHTTPESHQDDVEFFMKMLDMGKRMGVLSKDFKPSMALPEAQTKKEDEPKPEGLLDDLAYGDMQKGAEKSEETVTTEVPKMVLGKKDKRGLLARKG